MSMDYIEEEQQRTARRDTGFASGEDDEELLTLSRYGHGRSPDEGRHGSVALGSIRGPTRGAGRASLIRDLFERSVGGRGSDVGSGVELGHDRSAGSRLGPVARSMQGLYETELAPGGGATQSTPGISIRSGSGDIGRSGGKKEMTGHFDRSLTRSLDRPFRPATLPGHLAQQCISGVARENNNEACEPVHACSDSVRRIVSFGSDDDDNRTSNDECYTGEGYQEYSGERRANRNLPTLKLETYDGTTPLETFLAKFNNCSEYYGWSERDRLFHLRASLDKTAGNILWDAGVQSSTADVITLLRNRFGNQNQAERFRAELKARRRKNGEPLQAVYQDVRRLMALAFPGQTGSISEIVGRDAFLDALSDPAFKLRVLEREPLTLDEALNTATRLEALGFGATQDLAFDDAGRRVREKHVRIAEVRQGEVRNHEMDNVLAEYKKELEAMRLESERWRNWAVEQQTRWTPEPMPEWSPRQLPVQRQPQFQTPATMPSQQPQYRMTPQQQFRQSPELSGIAGSGKHKNRNFKNRTTDPCHGCGSLGHWKRECPNLMNQGASSSARASHAKAGGAGLNGSPKSSPETYIEIDVMGCKCCCLLDTGCDHSIVPRRMVPTAILDPVDIDVYAANGTRINVLGMMKLRFTIEGMVFTADLLVSEDVQELMLGYDWLVAQCARWHFDERVLVVRGKAIPLKVRRSRASVRRIYVRERTTIPSSTEQNVPIRMVHSSLRTPEADWLVDPRTLSDKVFLARVLLPGRDECAAVRVVNLSDKPYNMEQGVSLGLAQVARVLQEKETCSIAEAFHCGTADQYTTTSEDTVDTPSEGSYNHVHSASSRDELKEFNRTCEQSMSTNDEHKHLMPIVDSLPDELDDQQRCDAVEFIKDYRDVFSKDELDLGCTPLIEHRIDTGDAKPVRQGLRRHPQVHLDLIDREIEKMARAGVIEPSCSPWASNVVVVAKHDKTPRITLDYRALNSVTYKDSYPLPNIADCLDAFKGSSYFGILDLRSSFYQVPLANEDRDKTAFITRRGQWRFSRLPMGLSNSPGTFQRLMDLVLRSLTWSTVLVYIDDIVVFGKSYDELKIRLAEVFSRLRVANLKLKPSKVRLFQKEITFLGHRISQAGVAMDEGKIRDIVQWPVPQSVHDVRMFLGICGYYRRFSKNYAEVAAPLHELTRKLEPFVWTDRRQRAFESLKEHLTTAPVLAMSQDDGQFVLDVDASDIAAGAVLQQKQDGELRVIGYASRIFHDCERKYCVTKKELAALVFGLKQYRQYLLGRKCIIRTDHSALLYLRTAKELVEQQARWLDFIEEFDFELVHRAGVSHGNADAMSRRRPCETSSQEPCKQCNRQGKRAGGGKSLIGSVLGPAVRSAPGLEETLPTPVSGVTETAPGQLTVGQAVLVEGEDVAEESGLVVGAVLTRAQRRLAQGGAQESETMPSPPIGLGDDAAETSTDRTGCGRRANRRRRRSIAANDRISVQWTTAFIAESQSKDTDIGQLKQWIETGNGRPAWDEVRGESPDLKSYWQQWDSLVLQDGIVYRQLEESSGKEPCRQLLVPRLLRGHFMDMIHRGVAGHLGAFKTRAHVGQRGYWFQWRRDVDIYCRRCVICNEYHKGRLSPRQGALRPMVLGAPAERWCCDLTGPHPRSANGFLYIMTAIDAFSKFAVLVPIRDKSAVTVARAIMDNVFLRFGAGEVLTDGGCEFRNELLGELCRLMGVAKATTTAYRPQTNSVSERSHLTFNSMLAKVVSVNQRDWDERLKHVAFCYNASVHESTLYSPFFLMHGSEPRYDVDLQIGNMQHVQYYVNDYADMLIHRLEDAYVLVREQLKVTANRMRDWYDKKVHVQSFDVGDEVYVLNLRLYQHRSPKWVRRYSDVARVERKINSVTYVVTCNRWREKRKIVHVDKLKLKRSVQEMQAALARISAGGL